MEERAKDLISRGDYLFGKKATVNSLHQTIAEQFYPERASFTFKRFEGDEFADHMMSSFPSMARRDLANQIASMLRKDDWFDMSVMGMEEQLSHKSKVFLDHATKIQQAHMLHRSAGFNRATSEGDHDYVTFGQNVIQVGYSYAHNGMLYTCHHMKDCAWAQDYKGEVVEFHRKCKKTYRDLARAFGEKKLASEMKEKGNKNQNEEFTVRHVVIPADEYNEGRMPDKGDGKGVGWKEPYVSVWIDVENSHILEEVDSIDLQYNVAQWQQVSGSAYAHSPATIVCLPDARLIQDMTRVLLEAGEIAVLPPMVATRDAIRGDIALYSGGITYLDHEYDERSGDALRPLTRDTSGIPLGMDMAQEIKAMITEGFYLNKLRLPVLTDMTAYEVRQRMEEWVRQALPIFRPMEVSYNGGLCEMTFNRMMRIDAFGRKSEIPDEIYGSEIEFKFKSPLQGASQRADSDRFMEMQQFLAAASQFDPMVAEEIDISKSFRSAISGLSVPQDWIRDERTAEEAKAGRMAMIAAAQQQEQMPAQQSA